MSGPLPLDGDYEAVGDVLYLSTSDDDKLEPCVVSAEGHAVRLTDDGRVTHVTVIGARWLFDRDGELVATLPDGRRLRLAGADLAGLFPA